MQQSNVEPSPWISTVAYGGCYFFSCYGGQRFEEQGYIHPSPYNTLLQKPFDRSEPCRDKLIEITVRVLARCSTSSTTASSLQSYEYDSFSGRSPTDSAKHVTAHVKISSRPSGITPDSTSHAKSLPVFPFSWAFLPLHQQQHGQPEYSSIRTSNTDK